MSEQQQPTNLLPPGTYYLSALMIGGEKVEGQCIRLHWSSPLTPEHLAQVAQNNAASMVSDELAGAAPGMWWVLQVMVFDAWGRAGIMHGQSCIDRTLDRDELAGELARVAPEAFATIGEGLARLLAFPARSDEAQSWPSAAPTSTARH